MSPDNPLTGANSLPAILGTLRAAQQATVPTYEQRMADLARLRSAFVAHLPALVAAMDTDFGRRSRHESLLTDGMTVLSEIDHTRKQLRAWMRPRGGWADLIYWPARIQIRYQPLGVIGIIAPWNYPVNLSLVPLVAAIAAGNHVMLKPSEHTPRTSEALALLLREVFPADRVTTILGGADVAAEFAGLPFDHLFFTGSTAVGKMVMASAAKNLTPVTLELGGKSPAIVAPDYPIQIAAERISAGKWINAGQTCIASDYVLLPPERIEAFVAAMRRYVENAYPDLPANPDFSSVISERQHARLLGYLADARQKGATIIALAPSDPAKRVLAPTLVLNATDEMAVLQEEIFGPILPLVAIKDVDAAIAYINARPRPLALYHFDHDAARIERVLNHTVAGGVSVNETLFHIAQSKLPFGGVGPSGMGRYHARDGFLAFSHQKGVLYQARFSSLQLMRPPYRRLADSLVKLLTR